MTKREIANRKRCIEALERHWRALPADHKRTPGPVLYGLLDAAFGQLEPSDADAGRANALRWIRRRGQASKRRKKSPAKQRRGQAYHNRAVKG